MVDILIFVYENFFASGIYPSHSVLQSRLFAAGFSEGEVQQALDWLDQVGRLDGPAQGGEPEQPSVRCLDQTETARLGLEGWSFLLFLENNRIISPLQREWILATLSLLEEDDEQDISRVQLMVLIMLWRQGDVPNMHLLEEMIHRHEWALQ
jgi:Smg protein